MFHQNLKKLVKENTNFRKVVFTGKHSQLVLMSLRPGEEIGEETHPTIDQIFTPVVGEGEAVVEGKVLSFKEHEILVVPAGTLHNIRNTGREPLRFYTIYAPPAHADGTIHKTKAEAEKEEVELEGKPLVHA